MKYNFARHENRKKEIIKTNKYFLCWRNFLQNNLTAYVLPFFVMIQVVRCVKRLGTFVRPDARVNAVVVIL